MGIWQNLRGKMSGTPKSKSTQHKSTSTWGHPVEEMQITYDKEMPHLLISHPLECLCELLVCLYRVGYTHDFIQS